MDTQNPSIFSSISPGAFSARLGLAETPLVLDVRRQARFDESPRLLACAQRCAPEDLAALAASRPAGDVLVYCVYGHNVSEEAAALLQTLVGVPIPSQVVSHIGELCSFDAMLEAAMPVYDALYVWCRDRVAAQDETHNCKPAHLAGASA